jgi:hypothetical protein
LDDGRRVASTGGEHFASTGISSGSGRPIETTADLREPIHQASVWRGERPETGGGVEPLQGERPARTVEVSSTGQVPRSEPSAAGYAGGRRAPGARCGVDQQRCGESCQQRADRWPHALAPPLRRAGGAGGRSSRPASARPPARAPNGAERVELPRLSGHHETEVREVFSRRSAA